VRVDFKRMSTKAQVVLEQIRASHTQGMKKANQIF
jgi:hypothetical protein